MERVALVVGRNVQRLRLERGWSQQDLADRLEVAGRKWSRAAVGMLESKGVRGERLSDIAALCMALGTSLPELLATDDDQRPPFDPSQPSAGWVAAALRGDVLVGKPISPERQQRIARYVGRDLPESATRMAAGFGITLDELRAAVHRLSGQDSPTALRDALAGIDEKTPREEARVKRANATRELRGLILDGDSTPEELERLRAIGQRIQSEVSERGPDDAYILRYELNDLADS